MRRFLFVPFIFLLSSLIFLIFILLALPPKIEDNLVIVNLVYFFTFFWIIVAVASSFLIYFVNFVFIRRKTHALGDLELTLRKNYRRSLRQAVIIASVLVALGVLKILDSLTSFNLILTLLIGLSSEIFLSRK